MIDDTMLTHGETSRLIMLEMLLPEEINALLMSHVCVQCGHRRILHDSDSDYVVLCRIPDCGCSYDIDVGDYSEWSMEIYKL